MATSNLKRLCKSLNYLFQDESLLKQALTHRSAAVQNNERLEFLGDSILSYVISNALYNRFPERSEGELSRLRAFLVKGEMLSEIALEINLGDYLILGQGEMKSGGFRRTSILADALEAVFAAVFLDGGIVASQNVILHLFESRLNDENLNHNLKDPKTQLQELLQAQKHPLPKYSLQKLTGEEHDQIFYVLCEIPKLDLAAEGKGPNRRKAEQRAAKKLLKQLSLADKSSSSK